MIIKLSGRTAQEFEAFAKAYRYSHPTADWNEMLLSLLLMFRDRMTPDEVRRGTEIAERAGAIPIQS